MNRSSSSHVALALSLSVLAACGAAPSTAPSARPTTWVEVQRVPFHATLPSGSVVALDEEGVVTVDGDPAFTLETDGRVEDLDGETIAALLPDGRVSFGGELIGSTVRDARMMEGNVAVLELEQDRSLTLRRPDGQEVATVPVIGATPGSRDTVLFVVAVHLLALASDDYQGGAQEILDGETDVVRMRVPIEGRPVRGLDTAPITIVMFEDFQCPFCVRAESTMESLRQTYGDRVRFVLVHQPLPFHDHAEDAATFAEEALAQRGSAGFWAAHDRLFANATALERADLLRYAGELGLDVERMRAALEGDLHRARLTEDQALASRIGVTGTPCFFINGIRIVGAQPVSVFEAEIDSELARVARLTAVGVPDRLVYARLMEGALADAPPEAPAAPSAPRPTLDPRAVYRVPVDGAPARGPDDALVTIVVFSDFQCPFCSRVVPTLERVRATYGDDVRLVFRQNPLVFHDHAQLAAEASLEAYAQGGDDAFWRMHDLLFANQATLAREDLERFAGEAHLDMRRFRRALDQHTHAAEVAADQALAVGLGSTGTPGFFINGHSFRGAQPFEAFQTLIDAELATARERVASGTPRRRVYDAIASTGATAPVYLPGTAPAPDADAGDAPDEVFAIPVPPGAPSRGAASAPITIQIFSDFQCPFCSRVLPTVETIATEYAGRVRFVWRNYPLPFHQFAELAAEAAMEVFAQRGATAFWAFHDVLFQHRDALAREDLETYAAQIPGVRMARFRAALDDHRHQATVQADMDAVRLAGAEIGTPSFFVNGHLLQGAQPIEAFRTLIDRVLAERAAH